MDFCRSPHCGRRPSFTGLFFSFGSDPCFPAPAHDQYLSCGSLRHAVWCFRRLYHIGDQEYHRLRFAPRFPRLDDRCLPVGIPVQPHEKLWAAVLGEFAGTSLIGGLVSYPLAALFMGSSKGAFSIFPSFPFPAAPGASLLSLSSKGSISFKQIR